MFYYKKLALIAFSLMASLLFIGCGSGGSGSQNVTSVATYGITVNSSLLKDGQKYTVQVFSDDNDSESYASCTVAGTTCVTNIPQASFMVGNVNIAVTQNNALIVAGTIDSNYYLTQSASPTIYLDEVTTGNYILDELQTIADDSFPDVDVQNSLIDTLNIDVSDPYLYITAPVAAYEAFKIAQGSSTQADGFYKMFYSLYGTPGDPLAPISADANSSIQTSVVSAVTSVFKTGVLQMDPDNPGIRTRSVAVDLTALNNKATPEAKASTENILTRNSTEINTLGKSVTGIFIKPIEGLTAEDKRSLEIAQSVIGLGCKGLDLAFPGLGTILNAISGGIFGGLIGPPSDPNKPMIDVLNKVESAVKEVSFTIQNVQFQNLDIESKKQLAGFEKSLTDVNTSSAEYLGMLKHATKPDKPTNDFVNAQLIDAYLDTKIKGSKDFNDEINTINGWFGDKSKNDTLITSLQALVGNGNVALINSTLSAKLKSEVDIINNSANKVDLDANSSSNNIIACRKNIISESLKLQNQAIRAIELTRNYQLGAAYLRFASKYREQLNTIKSSVPGFGKDYATSVNAINEYYKNLETDFVAKMANSRNAIIGTIGNGMYSPADRFFDSAILTKSAGANSANCSITYWDGANVGYDCNVTKTKNVNYFIGNLESTCQSSQVKLIGQFGDSTPVRYACAVPLTSSKNIDTKAFISDNLYNQRKYWVLASENGDLLGTSSVAYVQSPNYVYPRGGMILFNYNSSGEYEKLFSAGNSRVVYTTKPNNKPQMIAGVGRVDYSWYRSGLIFSGPAFVQVTSQASIENPVSVLGYVQIAMDVNYTAPSNKQLFDFAILGAFDAGKTAYQKAFYGSLGCTSSDCAVILEDKDKGVNIKFDDGTLVVLSRPIIAPGAGILDLNIKTGSYWKPDGEWTSKCTNMLYANGWAKAQCNVNPTIGKVWSSLNYRTCGNHQGITVDANNKLSCK